MSLIRFDFQNNHGNQSSVEPYYSPQSDQANSDDTIFRGNHRNCSLKKVFLKILQNSQQNTCVRVFFYNDAGLRPGNVLENRLRQSCFSVNLAKFLRIPFFTIHLQEIAYVLY